MSINEKCLRIDIIFGGLSIHVHFATAWIVNILCVIKMFLLFFSFVSAFVHRFRCSVVSEWQMFECILLVQFVIFVIVWPQPKRVPLTLYLETFFSPKKNSTPRERKRKKKPEQNFKIILKHDNHTKNSNWSSYNLFAVRCLYFMSFH